MEENSRFVFVLSEEVNKEFDNLFAEPLVDGLKIIKGWDKTASNAINVIKIQNLEPDCIVFSCDFFLKHYDIFQHIVAAPILKFVPIILVTNNSKLDLRLLTISITDIVPPTVDKLSFLRRLKIICDIGHYRKHFDKNFLITVLSKQIAF